MSDYKMNQMVNQDHLKVKASQLPSIKCLLLCACACNFIAIKLILKLLTFLTELYSGSFGVTIELFLYEASNKDLNMATFE